MKKISAFVLLVCLLTMGFPSTSTAADFSKYENVEWNLGFITPDFDISGSHNEIQDYLPWYRYEPMILEFTSPTAPISLRAPKSIKLDFSKNECSEIPIQIRRQVPKEVATDISNPITVNVHSLSVNTFPKYSAKSKPIASVTASSWEITASIIEIQVRICKSNFEGQKRSLEESFISLGMEVTYARNLNAIQNQTRRCHEVILDKCFFSTRISPRIEVDTSDFYVSEQIDRYTAELNKLQQTLNSEMCQTKEIQNRLLIIAYCNFTSETVQVLSQELLVLQSALAEISIEKAPSTPVDRIVTSEELEIRLSPKVQKKTITCAKGIVTKKVIAVKPKCPSGYKKK